MALHLTAAAVRASYESVRVLSMVASSLARHTGHMTVDAAAATTFVTGAAGFIGTELVRILVARGHRVFGLTQSVEGAQRVRRVGALPVMGDLLENRRQTRAPVIREYSSVRGD
jgi:NADPH:quinone reductase-like Zn-dependent oxidoreductase